MKKEKKEKIMYIIRPAKPYKKGEELNDIVFWDADISFRNKIVNCYALFGDKNSALYYKDKLDEEGKDLGLIHDIIKIKMIIDAQRVAKKRSPK